MKIIIENRVDRTLPEEFQLITEETRESIYFLRSLNNLFSYHIVPKGHLRKDFLDETSRKIENSFEKFDELESYFYFPKREQLNEKGLFKLEYNADEYVEKVLAYIYLKETVDKIQYDILEYLFNNDRLLLDTITDSKEHLSNLKLSIQLDLLIMSAFTHSKDEDRFDNFVIHFSDQKLIKEVKKFREYPIKVKVRNYDFLIKKNRMLYSNLLKEKTHLISQESKLRDEALLEKLTIKQLEMDRKLSKLNIIGFLIALISLIYGTIHTYFVWIDHYNKP